jgi:hypothetical protein
MSKRIIILEGDKKLLQLWELGMKTSGAGELKSVILTDSQQDIVVDALDFYKHDLMDDIKHAEDEEEIREIRDNISEAEKLEAML